MWRLGLLQFGWRDEATRLEGLLCSPRRSRQEESAGADDDEVMDLEAERVGDMELQTYSATATTSGNGDMDFEAELVGDLELQTYSAIASEVARKALALKQGCFRGKGSAVGRATPEGQGHRARWCLGVARLPMGSARPPGQWSPVGLLWLVQGDGEVDHTEGLQGEVADLAEKAKGRAAGAAGAAGDGEPEIEKDFDEKEGEYDMITEQIE